MQESEKRFPEIENPFTVITPEKLDAETADQLFVEIFSDFPQIRNPGHALILGARGSGKSMMFRCLLPDVQMLHNDCRFTDLSFIAFHIPIKNTQLKITDLRRLDMHHASAMINEHFLALSVLIEVLSQLSVKFQHLIPTINISEYTAFHENTYSRYLRLCGCTDKCELRLDSAGDFFDGLYEHALGMHAEFIRYIISINPDMQVPLCPYNLPLLTFQSFLIPFLNGLKVLLGVTSKNIHLFIDDADNLSKTQTQVLNSWLATRTQPEISLKVSAQIGKFKSFVSTNGTTVESPHDYLEVNISDKYTTSSSGYYKRVKSIVEKRLEQKGITDISAECYFAPYEKQEDAVKEEAARLRNVWAEKGRGNRRSDDALRYARPNYIRELGGSRKARSTYMYAGLEHLVHLSSGVIRYFLDSAALMFDETLKKADGKDTVNTHIPYSIQNRVARLQGDKMMFTQFRKLERDVSILEDGLDLTIPQKLQNLIFSMGFTFHDILVSDRSERRVFSIALTNIPNCEIKEVLEFAVQTGYLHEATIGNKAGTGRTWLYIMNRCLAPEFNLDPTGFAGYLFVTNEALLGAMHSGKRLREIDSTENLDQMDLFD